MRKISLFLTAVLVTGLVAVLSAPASAFPVSVDIFAAANSSTTDGTPLDTGIDLTAGDNLSVSVPFEDFWRAGGAPSQFSNADGQGNPFGGYFGNWSQDGHSTLYGTLVGMIGAGPWFDVGTSFDQIVSDTGRLVLVYWDSYSLDNSGYVTARIDVNPGDRVPEPASLALFGFGLVGLGLARRRKAA